MHETPEDLAWLQQLLDDSYARAGEHLLSIHTPELRLDAARLAAMLTGVRVLSLATVTAKGEPRVGPVDGIFYRGRWHFGSAQNSVRFRHIRARPQVSAAHTIGEELAVTVHGVAAELDMASEETAEFRATLAEIYPGWAQWATGNPYARIDAKAMFTFHMPAASG
jgi:uncharacterized pyridoxamine 5'-phosphate oxidase family protein